MTRLFLCCVLFGSVSTQAAAPKKAKPKTSFQKVKISAQDLADVLHVGVYKFRLDFPKGQKFRLVLREISVKGAAPKQHHAFDFEKASDQSATLRVAFIRDDGKFGNGIFSDREWTEYSVHSTGCKQTGFTTLVQIPLVFLEPNRKSLIMAKSDKQAKSFGTEPLRLLTVAPQEPGKPAPSPATTYPRSELIIEPRK